MDSFQTFIEKRIQENSLYKGSCFEKIMKSEMKLNSKYLFELTTLEINKICRMQYFFWYCLNTTVCEYSNFNIGTVNAIQKKFVYCTKLASKLKVRFY